MAFSRKFLAALGIEADKVDEIITAHTEVTDALKADRDKFKADAEKLPNVQKELDELKAEAEKNNGKNPFEVKYNALKEEFEAYKADQAAKQSKADKEKAYRAILKEAGIPDKRIDAVLRVSNVDGAELDENGAIKEKDSLLKSIKEEWADFIPSTGKQGANTKNPPSGGNGSGKYSSKEEIMKIKDTVERQQAMAENHELFGI